MSRGRHPRPCPTCGQRPRVDRRTYSDRAEAMREAARARRRGLTVAEYRAAVGRGESPPTVRRQATDAIPTITYARRRGSSLVHRYHQGEPYDHSVCGVYLGIHCVIGGVASGERECPRCVTA